MAVIQAEMLILAMGRLPELPLRLQIISDLPNESDSVCERCPRVPVGLWSSPGTDHHDAVRV